MKRFGVMLAVAAAICLGACDHQESASDYNPKVDGVIPHDQSPPDASILENQRKLYDTMVAANGGNTSPGSKTPAATAPATATAPTPEAAPEGTTTAPAPPAPGGEGATPAPPKE